MTNIEDRADDYVKHYGNTMLAAGKVLKDAFCAGAKSQYVEMTKWNSPDNPPEYHGNLYSRTLLGKIGVDGVGFVYVLCAFDHSAKVFVQVPTVRPIQKIIGWRPIYDFYEPGETTQ